MKKFIVAAMAAAVLAGCGESRDDDDTGTPTDPTTPPVGTDGAVAVGNVTSAAFDADAGTLAVQITLDGSDVLQQYVADGSVDGYSRFTQQDDPLDREFKAFAAEAADGSLQAVVVMDGGQFNRFFGGGTITQNSYTAPTTGLVSYAGNYVGLSNVGPLLLTGNGADPSLVPGSTTQITGTVFINADFADGQLNGAIYDRVFDPDGGAIDLQTVVLTATDIGADGQFVGTVEFEDLTGVGTYNGAFGGADAANIAGVVSLGEGFLDGATVGGVETTQFDGLTGEAEYGVFVLGQCPAGGADCFDAN